MRSTTRISGPGGTTVVKTNTSMCGCGAFGTLIAALVVITAPVYFAQHGDWPLGMTGAVLAYVAVGLLIVGLLTVGFRSARKNRPAPQPAYPDPPPAPPPV